MKAKRKMLETAAKNLKSLLIPTLFADKLPYTLNYGGFMCQFLLSPHPTSNEAQFLTVKNGKCQ
jgi:hypothetical protein